MDVKQFKKPHRLFLFVYGFFSFICNYVVDDEQRKHRKKKKSENGKIVTAREVVCPFLFLFLFLFLFPALLWKMEARLCHADGDSQRRVSSSSTRAAGAYVFACFSLSLFDAASECMTRQAFGNSLKV